MAADGNDSSSSRSRHFAPDPLRSRRAILTLIPGLPSRRWAAFLAAPSIPRKEFPPMSRRTSRRYFLRDTALAGVGFWAAGGVLRAEGKPRSPLERLRVAGIGVGGKGSSDIDQAGELCDVVGLCDIDDNRLDAKSAKFPKARKYNDFRQMLHELERDVDAVTVSTPDHTHAPAAVMAMKMKKHVYCQKPLTHSVHEARVMRETARRYGVCTQMGNQGTAEDGLRRAVELVRGGVIGPVRELHVWTNRPIWPQSPAVTSRPSPAPCPAHVHWDLFLGPAPERPYAEKYYHPFAWRGWWDFGTGALGDMACHTANMGFMALKLGYPTSVEAESEKPNPETYPGWARVVWEFPAREDMPPVKMYWYEGKKDGTKLLPPERLTRNLKLSDSGSLLVGDHGKLFSPNDYGADFMLVFGKNVEKNIPIVPASLPRTTVDITHWSGKGNDYRQKLEWVRAIREGKPEIALANFDYAGVLAETVLLGNLAIRAEGKKLEWDGPACRVTNDSAANAHVETEHRQGWTL
jgi:predicted dehydrogenase